MSCFRGLFPDLPGVSCDRFTGSNLSSDQFFLSHCHTDHMQGLGRLRKLLRTKNSFKVNHRIYCSPLSLTLLLGGGSSDLIGDSRFMRALEPDTPTWVDVFDKAEKSMYKLKVTSIPASHCPGSVMFLFETHGGPDEGQAGRGGPRAPKRVLYTGDFRFENLPLGSLASLHDSLGAPLALDKMYLDTTFCSESYPTFPPREEAVRRVWDIVHNWVGKNEKPHVAKHVVLIDLAAQYGSEAILRHIYEKSGRKWKVHVGSKKHSRFLCTKDLGSCTDSDPRAAEWVHACSWRDPVERGQPRRASARSPRDQASRRQLPCQAGPFEVCRIRPSAMYFSKERLEGLQLTDDPVVVQCGGQDFRVCYSCHSSLEELRSFMEYFKPAEVEPCVIPEGSSRAKVLGLLSAASGAGPASDDQASHPFDSGTSSWSDYAPERPDGRHLAEDRAAKGVKRKLAPQSDPSGDSKRHSSLPHHLTVPVITITPSSPSPDINHPDRPDYFEGRLYLETSNRAGEENNEDEASSASSGSIDICFEALGPVGGGCGPEDEEDENRSTPDLDIVLSKAKNNIERDNCRKFAKARARRSENGGLSSSS